MIGMLTRLSWASPAAADISDSGALAIPGQATIAGTATVQGVIQTSIIQVRIMAKERNR